MRSCCKTLSSQTRIAISVLENLMISVFKLFGPGLTTGIQKFADLMGQATKEIEARADELGQQFDQLFETFGQFTDGESKDFIESIGAIATSTMVLVNAIATLMKWLKQLNTIINVLTGAGWVAQKAFLALASAMAPKDEGSRKLSEDHAEALSQLSRELAENAVEIANLEEAQRSLLEVGFMDERSTANRTKVLQDQIDVLESQNRTKETGIEILKQAIFFEGELEAAERDRVEANENSLEESQKEIQAAIKAQKAVDKAKKAADEASAAYKKLIDAATSAIKTFQTAAGAISDAFNKAILTDTQLLLLEQQKREAELEATFDAAIAAATAAGKDITALEAEKQRAMTQLMLLNAVEREELFTQEAKEKQDLLDEESEAQQEHQATLTDLALQTAQSRLNANEKNLSKVEKIERQLALDILKIQTELKAKLAELDSESEEGKAEGAALIAAAAAEEAEVEADAAGATADANEEGANDAKEAWLKAYKDITGAAIAAFDAMNGAIDFTLSKADQLLSTFAGLSIGLSDLINIAGGAAEISAEEIAEFEAEKAALVEDLKAARAESDQEAIDEAKAALAELEEGRSPADVASDTVNEMVEGAILFAQSLADNMDVILTALIDGLPDVMIAAANAIGPVIQALAENMDVIIGAIVAGLGTAVQAIADNLPDLIRSIIQQLDVIIIALIQAAEVLLVTLFEELPSFITMLLAQLPVIIKQLAASLGTVIEALLTAIPDIIIALVDAIPEIVTALLDALPVIIDGLLEGLLGENGLVARLPEIAIAIVMALVETLPIIIAKVPLIVAALIIGIIQRLPQLIVAFVTSLAVDVIAKLPKIAFELVAGIVKSIGKVIAGIATMLWNNIFSGIADFGIRIGRSIWNGIKAMGEQILNFFKNVFREAISFGLAKTDLDKGGSGSTFGRVAVGVATGGLSEVVRGVASLFQGGINVVPKEGLVRVHPGEAIIPADRNPFNPGVTGAATDGVQTTSTGGGASMSSTSLQVNVMMDSRLVDGVVVRGVNRGHMPEVQRMFKKSSGTKIGIDNRNFQSFVS